MYERIQDLVGVKEPAETTAESVAQSTTETASETIDAPQSREVLDNVKCATIVALVRLGGSRRMAAREVGCHPATIARTAGRDPHFAERLAHAESLADRKALDIISRAQDQEKYWRAAAWVLERRNPDEFARRMPNTFTAEQVMEVIARLIRVLLPAVPDERRDEVMLEFNDTLSELGPLVANASPHGPSEICANNLSDNEGLNFAQVEDVRRAHWERSENWIRGLPDDRVHEAHSLSFHRAEKKGGIPQSDIWTNRIFHEWMKRCENRPVTHPGDVEVRSSVPFAVASAVAVELRSQLKASGAQHSTPSGGQASSRDSSSQPSAT